MRAHHDTVVGWRPPDVATTAGKWSWMSGWLPQIMEDWQMPLIRPRSHSIIDDSFEFGCDWILSIRVVARATEAGRRINMHEFLASPRVGDLGAPVERSAD